MDARHAPATPVAALSGSAGAPRWLLLVHQLPSRPSNLRVRTWRRLQQIGALAVKQAVYTLPDSSGAREDFEWLKKEIESAGGEATVFAADIVDAWSNDALIEEFRRSREKAYTGLARDAERLLRRMGSGQRPPRHVPTPRVVQQLRERLAAIERVDFFASAGRDRVVSLLGQIGERTGKATRARVGAAGPARASGSYHGRSWVTRTRPGVDRMASAWLIRRFIDAEARFVFVRERGVLPKDSVAFDMFGGEFTHEGDRCTFEVLCGTFELDTPALASISAVVHDLDLKDGRFKPADAPTVGLIIEGLRLAYADDHELLVQGMAIFEALCNAFEQQARVNGPRAVAKPRPRD